MLNINVKPGEWVSIGRVSAVVTTVYDSLNIEVVYLNDKKKAINENAILKNNCWEFKNTGVCGGYADKYDRLREFVSILRQGRYYKG